MTRTPTRILFALAGKPKVLYAKAVREDCAVCGLPTDRAVPWKKAISKTDTDIDRFSSTQTGWVCAACVWCSAGRPPDTFRMWSVLWREDGVFWSHHPAIQASIDKQAAKDPPGKNPRTSAVLDAPGVTLTNRGNTRPIVHTLLDPPIGEWFCAVAVSGQIHTLRFVPLSAGSTIVVQFERARVVTSPETWRRVLHATASLRKARFRDEEILSGEPSHASLYRDLSAWRNNNNALFIYRRSSILELALWCCTKDTIDEYIALTSPERGQPDGTSRTPVARLSGEHSERPDQSGQILGLGAKGAASRVQSGDDVRPIRERDARTAPDSGGVPSEVHQVDLFGGSDAGRGR